MTEGQVALLGSIGPLCTHTIPASHPTQPYLTCYTLLNSINLNQKGFHGKLAHLMVWFIVPVILGPTFYRLITLTKMTTHCLTMLPGFNDWPSG